jgi:hypothetical protein
MHGLLIPTPVHWFKRCCILNHSLATQYVVKELHIVLVVFAVCRIPSHCAVQQARVLQKTCTCTSEAGLLQECVTKIVGHR